MKAFTIKDSVTNSYIGPIMINSLVFFHKKPTIYSTKKVMKKLIEKLYIKYPTIKGRLILEKDFH